MKPHEVDAQTTRRATLGLVGGFLAIAFGAAPIMHASATLDLDVEITGKRWADGMIDGLQVEVRSQMNSPLYPVWFTWDQKRKTRHNWEIENGAVPLLPDQQTRYQLQAPSDSGRINPGTTVNLTVFQKGEQQWVSIQFGPERGAGQ